MSYSKICILAGACLLALQSSAFAQFPLASPNESGSDRASGWLGGVQLGHNWQQGALVYGLETDFSWIDLDTQINKGFSGVGSLPANVPRPSAHTAANIDWYGTLRGRLGWTSGPVLFYGTGGLAYGRVELNSTFDIGQFLPAAPLVSQSSKVKAGWVLGAGVDYLWSPNVILSLGYQFIDLGRAQVSDASPTINFAQSATAHASFHEVNLGVSWQFAPPPRVSPQLASAAWEGWYAGGHAGYASGLKTNADFTSQTVIVSDARLKRDITLIGRRDDGLGIYRYRYLWSDTVYVGVMAQEVALLHPQAIVRSAFDDYLRVDYARLGMQLKVLAN
jgi:outer membrane immunogenic protein